MLCFAFYRAKYSLSCEYLSCMKYEVWTTSNQTWTSTKWNNILGNFDKILCIDWPVCLLARLFSFFFCNLKCAIFACCTTCWSKYLYTQKTLFSVHKEELEWWVNLVSNHNNKICKKQFYDFRYDCIFVHSFQRTVTYVNMHHVIVKQHSAYRPHHLTNGCVAIFYSICIDWYNVVIDPLTP